MKYKAYYSFYLACLFFLQILPLTGNPGIPWLFVALAVSPLYFGIRYALTASFFWGIILGALSFQNKFFYLFIFSAAGLSAHFFSQKLFSRRIRDAVCSLSAGLLYTVFLALLGEYPATILIWKFIVLNIVYYFHLFALRRLIPLAENELWEGEENRA